MTNFSIYGGVSEQMAVRNIQADADGPTARITIVLETGNMLAFGEALNRLHEVQREQTASRTEKPVGIGGGHG